MNTRFRLLLSKANIYLAHNVPLQIQMYEKAINPNIYRQIILNGTVPNTLDAYMLRASEIDRAFKLTNIRSAFTNYKGKGNGKPNFRCIKEKEMESQIFVGNLPLPVRTIRENLWTLTLWSLMDIRINPERSVTTVESLDTFQGNAVNPGNHIMVRTNRNSKTTKGNRNKDKGHNRNRL